MPSKYSYIFFDVIAAGTSLFQKKLSSNFRLCWLSLQFTPLWFCAQKLFSTNHKYSLCSRNSHISLMSSFHWIK